MAKISEQLDAAFDEFKVKILEIVGEGATTEAEFELPDLQTINDMEKEDLLALCEKVGLDVSGKKTGEVRTLLVTLSSVASGDTEELESADVKVLMLAIGLSPTKDLETNVEKVREYLASDKEDSAEEDSDEDKDEDDGDGEPAEEKDEDDDSDEEEKSDDSDEDEEETPKKSKKGKDDDDGDEEEESESEEKEESEDEDGEAAKVVEDDDEGEKESEDDGHNCDAIVKKAKLPKDSVMKLQLEAYNDACGKDEQIDVDDHDSLKDAYRELLKRLVDHEGEIAEWGVPYVREGGGWCCGLELDEVKVKGDKRQFGQCAVTKAVFYVDEDNEFVRHEPEGKKGKK